MRKDSSFSEEKEAKRLFPWRARRPAGARQAAKVFCFFFTKKKTFIS